MDCDRLVIGYDAVDVAALPAGGDYYLAYIDGNWPTYNEVKARFPNARILTITTTGENHADICDVESGDVTPDRATAGYGLMWDAIYCSVDTKPEVDAYMAARFGTPWNWYAADPTGVEHQAEGAVATQWAWPGHGSPGNYDISYGDASWIDPTPPTPPAPAPTPSTDFLDPELEIIVSLASSPVDAFNVYVRDKWAMYRTDELTLAGRAYLWAGYSGPWKGSLDFVLACIIDTAKSSGVLRPQFAGAV